MIGIGKDDWDLDVNDVTKEYLDFKLGKSAHSWCFTNAAKIRHNGSESDYGDSFGFGSLIGVHFDSENGALHFSLNRVPLGVAFTNIPNGDFYPVAISKSTRTKLKLVASGCFKNNLEFQCTRVIVRQLYNKLIDEDELIDTIDKYREIKRKQKEDSSIEAHTEDNCLFNPMSSPVSHKLHNLLCPLYASDDEFLLKLKMELVPVPPMLQDYIFRIYWDYFRISGLIEAKKTSFSVVLNYIITTLKTC